MSETVEVFLGIAGLGAAAFVAYKLTHRSVTAGGPAGMSGPVSAAGPAQQVNQIVGGASALVGGANSLLNSGGAIGAAAIKASYFVPLKTTEIGIDAAKGAAGAVASGVGSLVSLF